MPMQGFSLDTSKIRDISEDVLDEEGSLRIMPAAYWATTTPQERMLFGHRHAAYGLPTTELVERLQEIIAGRSAIEIGAGSGILAAALGITATDSHQQLQAKYRPAYDGNGQPRIRYGADVKFLDAAQAIGRYRPDVVVASWVTHKWNPRRPQAEGNEAGVNEEAVLDRCQAYVFVGNEKVHENKSIWDRPHSIEYPSFVYSRAANGTRDFISVWAGKKANR